MTTTFRAISLGALLVSATASCGGGGDDDGGPFTAKVDGQAWAATPLSISVMAVGGVPGSLLILGTQPVDGGGSRSINLVTYNVTGPGTYVLGVNSSVVGGRAQFSEAGNVWATPDSGEAGTLTITTLGGGRIVGTFSFTATPGTKNMMTTTHAITDGKFDLAFTGTVPPVKDNQGSKVSAMFNGVRYNAATVSTTLQGATGVGFSSHTETHGLELDLNGITASGTYTVVNKNPSRSLSAGRNNTMNCCWDTEEMGSIVVTSLTATRAKGTFSGTLQPRAGKPATAPLVITDGTFDVGIQ